MAKPPSIEERFTNAYDEYADALFRHCTFRIGDREKGRDLMQETFTKAWEYIAKGKEVENIRALLYTTANNLITDTYRRQAKRKEDSLEEMQEYGFEVEGNEDTTRGAEEALAGQRVTQILQEIEEPYRSAVIMRYIDELSPGEIADALNESANVVSVRINRGLKKLQSCLPEYGYG